MIIQAYDKETIDALYAEVERLKAGLHGHDGDDCPLCFIEDENKRLNAWVEYIEDDRIKLAEKIESLQSRIELLEAVRDAADRIYNRDMHSQSDEDRLREALASLARRPACRYWRWWWSWPAHPWANKRGSCSSCFCFYVYVCSCL